MRALWCRLAAEPFPEVGDIVVWGSDEFQVIAITTPPVNRMFLGHEICEATLEVVPIKPKALLCFPDLYEKGNFHVSSREGEEYD